MIQPAIEIMEKEIKRLKASAKKAAREGNHATESEYNQKCWEYQGAIALLRENEGKQKRPSETGEALGVALVKMVHLMYQNRTALSFLRALCQVLLDERDRREKESQLVGLMKQEEEIFNG